MSKAKPRLVVLISGSGSNLQAIIDGIEAGEIRAQISRVISNNPDAYGLLRAQTAGIATTVIDHRAYAKRSAYDQALAEHLDIIDPDLVVLAGFMRILGDALVERYIGRLINIHPSLLPAYRGRHTHQRVLDAGDAWHGCSVHFVIPALDAGPVIAQAAVAVRTNDTPERLESRVQAMEHRLYPQVVAWIAAGRVSMQNDQVTLDGNALATPPCLKTDDTA
jgi:phosphoribosylglycinamide formyltransferase-1